MPNYRRHFIPGQYYFITVVTKNRLPILIRHRRLLLSAYLRIRKTCQMNVIAWVLLPDHVHAIIRCEGDSPGKIVRSIKLSFTNRSQKKSLSSDKIWQDRYWDRAIRSESSLLRCIEYVHWNAVKHRYVSHPANWKYSSFHEYVVSGIEEKGGTADGAALR